VVPLPRAQETFRTIVKSLGYGPKEIILCVLALVLSAAFNTSGIHDLIHGHVLETQVPHKGLQEQLRECLLEKEADSLYFCTANPLKQGNSVAHLKHGQKLKHN
jgi:hypothetical protein